ncbi:unnamed protein product [Rotaria socialis]|uniref:NHL repeat containing protein n=2 Tax=Rotaria socialis TaxID=392032 RepID=A0A820TG43_9BILA|nr:unnamed protein product [Rotaria socialis]
MNNQQSVWLDEAQENAIVKQFSFAKTNSLWKPSLIDITIGALVAGIPLVTTLAMYLQGQSTTTSSGATDGITTTSATSLSSATTTRTTTSTATTTTTSTSAPTTSATSTTITSTITCKNVSLLGLYFSNEMFLSIRCNCSNRGITVAGKASGVAGSDLRSLRYPVSIFIDNNDTLYVVDRDNHRIVKYFVNTSTGVLVAGTGTPGSTASELSSSKDVAIDQYGAVIVADSNNYRIQSFLSGIITSGSTLPFNSLSNVLGQMRDLRINVNNEVYVTNSNQRQVTKYFPFNVIGVSIAGGNEPGNSANQLSTLYGNFINESSSLYVVDTGNNRIQKFLSGSTTGITVADTTHVSGSTSTLLSEPKAVIADSSESIIIKTNTELRYEP